MASAINSTLLTSMRFGVDGNALLATSFQPLSSIMGFPGIFLIQTKIHSHFPFEISALSGVVSRFFFRLPLFLEDKAKRRPRSCMLKTCYGYLHTRHSSSNRQVATTRIFGTSHRKGRVYLECRSRFSGFRHIRVTVAAESQSGNPCPVHGRHFGKSRYTVRSKYSSSKGLPLVPDQPLNA